VLYTGDHQGLREDHELCLDIIRYYSVQPFSSSRYADKIGRGQPKNLSNAPISF